MSWGSLLLSIFVVAVACTPSTPETAPSPWPLSTTPPPTRTEASPKPTPAATPGPLAAAAALRVSDAASLAEALEGAESGLRDGTGDGASLGLRQQAAYRQLAETPEWQPQVIDALPEALRNAARANITAATELRALTEPRDDLPYHWRIVAPAPSSELVGHYRAAADEFGVDWTYLAAIHLVETRMGRIRGTSTAGAQGPMQFLPSTWEAYGEGDIDSNRDAIRAAARYLTAHGAPGDMPRALFAYNRSQRYVRAIEAYAGVMRADGRAYRGYYHWQVFYRTTRGDALLHEGWPGT